MMMHEAIQFCHEVKKLGYKVFVQAVSITSYSDRELLDLVDLVNDLEPYAMSLVDTYGLLHQDNLLHYFQLLNYNLKPSIAIGYHSHNNFQLAYSNSMEVLREPADRTVLVDATLYGMGKKRRKSSDRTHFHVHEHCIRTQFQCQSDARGDRHQHHAVLPQEPMGI